MSHGCFGVAAVAVPSGLATMWIEVGPHTVRRSVSVAVFTVTPSDCCVMVTCAGSVPVKMTAIAMRASDAACVSFVIGVTLPDLWLQAESCLGGVNRFYGVTAATVCAAVAGCKVIDGAFQAETTIAYFSGECGGKAAVSVMDSSGISST